MATAEVGVSQSSVTFDELRRRHRLAQVLKQETLAERAGLQILNTDGQVLPGMEVTVRDENGTPLAPGQEGDLYTRGAFLFVGYVQGRRFTEQYFTPANCGSNHSVRKHRLTAQSGPIRPAPGAWAVLACVTAHRYG